MTRTLLLLNALALAVLVGLILQPGGSEASTQAHTVLATSPLQTDSSTPTGAMPASIQPPGLQPTSGQRLIF